MGAFYVNYTIRNADQKSILRVLARHKAFVSQEQSGAVVAFEQQSDEQDEKVIARLAAQLSKTLRTFVLAVLVHDSDIFWYQLYRDGRLSDEYNSTPDYWSPKSEPSGPRGGDASRLCSAFACTDVEKVESILRAPYQTYPDAMGRHADLIRTLYLPNVAVGCGFRDIVDGCVSIGSSVEDLAPTFS